MTFVILWVNVQLCQLDGGQNFPAGEDLLGEGPDEVQHNVVTIYVDNTFPVECVINTWEPNNALGTKMFIISNFLPRLFS